MRASIACAPTRDVQMVLTRGKVIKRSAEGRACACGHAHRHSSGLSRKHAALPAVAGGVLQNRATRVLRAVKQNHLFLANETLAQMLTPFLRTVRRKFASSCCQRTGSARIGGAERLEHQASSVRMEIRLQGKKSLLWWNAPCRPRGLEQAGGGHCRHFHRHHRTASGQLPRCMWNRRNCAAHSWMLGAPCPGIDVPV